MIAKLNLIFSLYSFLCVRVCVSPSALNVRYRGMSEVVIGCQISDFGDILGPSSKFQTS